MKRNSFLLSAGLISLILIGSAYWVGQSISHPDRTEGQSTSSGASSSPSGPVMVVDNGGGPVRVTFTDPPEAPGEPSTALGVFRRREDQRIYIGTGQIIVEAEVVNDEASLSAASDGPELEVVITGETILYEDVTDQPVISPEDVERGEMVVQRRWKPVDSLDALGENTIIRVWGEKRGDRVIANVLVYEPLRI